jgi:hypothetical protein
MDQRLHISEKNSGNAIRRISRGRSKSLRLVSCCLLLCSIVFVADCGKTPVKPAEFTANDVCFGCKEAITVKSYAAEFITSNGFVRKFDDFACLAANAKKVGRKNIVAIYAVDAETKNLFPIEQLQLLRSDRFVSPKKGGILAFQNPAKADSVAAQFKAEKVKLDDLLK